MSSVQISLVTFACIFGGTLLGLFLRTLLPHDHLGEESKDIMKMGIGIIGTLAALVMGLLIASAKANFDTMSKEIDDVAARVLLLDRILTEYGPETQEARDLLRRAVASAIVRIWPEEESGPAITKGRGERVDIEDVQTLVAKGRAERVNTEAVLYKLRQLSPRTDSQRWLLSRALEVSAEIGKVRWLLIAQTGKRSIPLSFLAILIFWLTIIFASFGLFSPRNPTIIVVLLVCAFSAAGAVFLILEMDTPISGLIKISSAPLRNTLTLLGGMATGKPQ